ncbi:beta-1,3-galactosyltransferase 1-like [Penaeus chinensis]|uniref:beta-1,3-galactosyltransferase 1-like n=1 Tax=Penaeus chinensis TaxID=139456 RepID=UPI001FB73AA1|nr:beta-1,3-galactosyltransferase 1-like [Penaeus chinensis]
MTVHEPPRRPDTKDEVVRGGNAKEKRSVKERFETGNGGFGASSSTQTPSSESDYDYYEDESADYNWSKDYYKYKHYARHYMYSDLFTSDFPIENGGLCPNSTRIFVFVNSRVDNTDTRSAIRKSYLKIFAKQKIPYAFLISKPSSKSAMIKLEEENRRFNDLVVVGSLEDYTNLTLKTGLMMRWVGRHCPADAYVAKVDDDVYVNVPRFLKVLEKKRQNTVLGQICSNCVPNTGNNLPLHMALEMTLGLQTRKNMPLTTFPPFATGPAYVIMADVIPLLEEASQLMQYFSFEDVFWTGFVVEKINQDFGQTVGMTQDPESVRFKYLTMRAKSKPLGVTVKRENVPGWRLDYKTSQHLQEGLRKTREAVIVHRIDWEKDRAFVEVLDRAFGKGWARGL